ncbi:MAG TPA: chromosome partitioning protein ParB [Erysipelotrichaceae bacterium]|nr:ParB/RepB/Spo0J family partition protein [Bacillota bacterium]HCY06330.1 chromosome partitioning protein ParB [Erysipelotrichaceae bacterium]
MGKKDDKKRLGRGLEAIFGDDISNLLEEIQEGGDGKRQIEVNVDEIRPNPFQPRKEFDEKSLKELSDSIKEHGIFTALIVRKSVTGYEIIAGERRWRAAKMANLSTVPCVVYEFDDSQMMEISILENIQREDLNPIEEATAYKNLMDRLGYTQEKLAKRVGKTREYCANMLRLLNLPKSVQDLVVNKELTMSHARPLLSLNNDDMIYDVALKIIDEKMSVRQVEKLMKDLDPNKALKKKKIKVIDPNLKYVEDLFRDKLQTKVSVDNKQIIIKYSDVDDLNRILDLLGVIE